MSDHVKAAFVTGFFGIIVALIALIGVLISQGTLDGIGREEGDQGSNAVTQAPSTSPTTTTTTTGTTSSTNTTGTTRTTSTTATTSTTSTTETVPTTRQLRIFYRTVRASAASFECTVEVTLIAGSERALNIRVIAESISWPTALGQTGSQIDVELEGPTSLAAEESGVYRTTVGDCVNGTLSLTGWVEVNSEWIDELDVDLPVTLV